MSTNKATTQYRSGYNEDRDCFISKDGRFICYRAYDPESKRKKTYRYEIGTLGITQELAVAIDDLNYEQDQLDRRENDNKDPLFEARRQRHSEDPDEEDAVDPYDNLSLPGNDPAEILTMEESRENPVIAKVRNVVETQFTPEQQDLFYKHFGEGKQLEEIRKEEVAATGKEKSPQSVLNRKKKMLAKVAKQVFGTEPVKHSKNPKKS
jgi:hypothetical protein